jgi:hypothetical protein
MNFGESSVGFGIDYKKLTRFCLFKCLSYVSKCLCHQSLMSTSLSVFQRTLHLFEGMTNMVKVAKDIKLIRVF